MESFGSTLVKDISYKRVRIYLKETFTIANESYSHCDAVVVRIKTENFEGVGEASPDNVVTGETVRTVTDALNKLKPALIGKDASEVRGVMGALDAVLKGNNTAKAAVDMALYDIAGKSTGRSVSSLLGGKNTSRITSITLGLADIESTVKRALAYKRQGFKILKIKTGLKWERDAGTVEAVRKAVGNRIRIIVDANQGYSVKEAISFINRVKDVGIDFVEQPVRARDLESLKKVRDTSDVPIMADESLKDMDDLLKISKMGATDMINIKLMKTGGIAKAMDMAEFAKDSGIKTMAGCMDETRIGVTAGMHFALAGCDADFVDLDSHLSHKNEVADRGVKTHNGINSVGISPGLGVRLRRGVL